MCVAATNVTTLLNAHILLNTDSINFIIIIIIISLILNIYFCQLIHVTVK
jgi:hypothetical protein